MKILVATDSYIHNLSGITTSVLALCSGLRHHGHEVKILSLSDCHQSSRNGDDIFIRSFPSFLYPEIRWSFTTRDPLIKELEAWKPDLIHIQSEGSVCRMANTIAKNCGAAVVMTCHTDYGYYVFGKNRSLAPAREFTSLAGYLLYRHADAVTVPSRKAASFPFLSKVRDRLTVIPNGMEIDKYRNRFSAQERNDFRRSLGIEAHEGVLVVVSRLSREKNIGELVSAFPLLLEKKPDAKLLIVGDGPDRKNLESLAEKLRLGEKAVFTGRINAEDVWRCYAAGDIYVSASTFEVHSMSCLEAMAAGLPMLCRADDALDGVLEHGKNGMIWHTRTEFADFACQLLSDERLRGQMADCSYRKAADYSNEAFTDAMLRLYENTIRKKH